MSPAQAFTKLKKLLGPKAGFQDDKKPSSPEQREQALAAWKTAQAASQLAYDAMEARRMALLKADAEYQRLRAEYTEARKVKDASGGGNYYRYTAGTSSSLFFHVAAQADTLDELVKKVEAKKQKEAA